MLIYSSMTPTPFTERKQPGILCLFDVDGTLTPARQTVSKEMLDTLKQLREHVAVGFVGGSDLNKIVSSFSWLEQRTVCLHVIDILIPVLKNFDYGFAENGLTAYRLEEQLPSQSFINWLGEEKYKKLIKFALKYISNLDLPVMRCVLRTRLC